MFKLRMWLSIGLVGLLVSGCLNLGSPVGPISGVVLDELTQAGVPGAYITVSGRTTITDSNGAFTLTGLQRDRDYSMSVRARSYVAKEFPIKVAKAAQLIKVELVRDHDRISLLFSDLSAGKGTLNLRGTSGGEALIWNRSNTNNDYAVRLSGTSIHTTRSLGLGAMSLQADDERPGIRRFAEAVSRGNERFLVAEGYLGDHRVRTDFPAAIAPPIGTTRHLWIATHEADGEVRREKVAVELRIQSARGLFWVDPQAGLPSSVIERFATELDQNWNLMMSHFGPIPGSELDGYEQINVVLAPLRDSYGGYFSSRDMYPSADLSNGGRYIYINSNSIRRAYEGPSGNIDYYIGVMFHELQHMQFFHAAVTHGLESTPAWVNEGFSNLAMDLVGYGFAQRVDLNPVSFLRQPHDVSLTNWEFRPASYGAAYLFWRYIMDRFGWDVIYKVARTPPGAFQALENITGHSYDQLFEDWAVTLWVYPRNLSENPIYQFNRAELPPEHFISRQLIDRRVVEFTLPIAVECCSDFRVRGYAPAYVSLDSGEYTIDTDSKAQFASLLIKER